MFPFIHQAELMDGLDKLVAFKNRLHTFRQVIDSDWPRIRRLITYYSTRNWQQFDAEWASIFDDSWPLPTNDLKRHDYFHQALELLFIPLQPEFDYAPLKIEFNGLFSKLTAEKLDSLLRTPQNFF